MSKIRSGFVSNSSSSSFIITDEAHPHFIVFKHFVEMMDAEDATVELNLEKGTVEDLTDNGTWSLCWKYGLESDDFLEQTHFNG